MDNNISFLNLSRAPILQCTIKKTLFSSQTNSRCGAHIIRWRLNTWKFCIDILHFAQMYLPSIVWVRRCVDELAEKLKSIGHRPHLNARAFVWTPTWLTRPSLLRNANEQCGHGNFRFCRCVFMCFVRVPLRLNERGQCWQLNGRRFACELRCRTKSNLYTKLASHWSHLNRLQREQ